jgi:hypothetical protein
LKVVSNVTSFPRPACIDAEVAGKWRSAEENAHENFSDGENADGLSMKCFLCEHTGWVCENHPDAPWDGEQACICGGAGMPCPQCNPSDLSHPPRPPAGTHIAFDKEGWHH